MIVNLDFPDLLFWHAKNLAAVILIYGSAFFIYAGFKYFQKKFKRRKY